jgi:hypothetical protein
MLAMFSDFIMCGRRRELQSYLEVIIGDNDEGPVGQYTSR